MKPKELSGTELAKLGFSFVDRELFFIADHPEHKHFTPYLRGTYETCKAKELKGEVAELDVAYEHIFITNGGCDWCKAHFESLKEPLVKLMQDQ